MTEAPPFTPEDQALLERLADRIVELRIETAAILTLETARPMAFIASQAMVFFEPIVQSLFRFSEYQHITRLLERRGTIESLTLLIESRAAARGRPERPPVPPASQDPQ